jgi:acyl dehydratase
MIQTGQTASVKRTFTQSDFDRFAALSGDDNPIHVDPEFAARTKFGRTVAHGMFLYSVVCGVLSSHLPGSSVLQVEQELMFPSATPAGEEVEIRVEITEVQPAEGLADLTTLVLHPDGTPGLQGRTRVHLAHPSTPLRTGFPIPNPQFPNFPIPDSRFPDTASLKGLTLGQRAQTRRTFTAADLAEYASLTGDHNPLYVKPKYAQKMGLDGAVVPGGLLGGLFSYLLGTELPGRGTNYLKQRLYFPAAAYVDRELTSSVEITRIRPEKELVNLSTACTEPSGQVVCYGEALVLVSDVERAA